jgi:hypothetical protein
MSSIWSWFFGVEDDPPKDPKLIHQKYLITEQIKKSNIVLMPIAPLKLTRQNGVWKDLKINTRNVSFSEEDYPPLKKTLPIPIPRTPRKGPVCNRADFINHPDLPPKPVKK